MGDSLDMLAHYNTSRVFVFDGIASVVEYALPNAPVQDDRPTLSSEACGSLSKILIRFILGFYNGDLSLTIPATMCLEKIYRHRVELMMQPENASDAADTNSATVPDKDYWQNIAVALYTVCRSSDPEISAQGSESYSRLVLETSVDQIPDEKWCDILFLMLSKQPPLAADQSRANTFAVLGALLIKVLPHLSHSEDLRDDVVDLIQQTADLARENLRQGRRGSVSPLFEKTLQAVTRLSNHMTEWDDGDQEFGAWASDTLLAELERVGAAGAALANQRAVKQQNPRPIATVSASETVTVTEEKDETPKAVPEVDSEVTVEPQDESNGDTTATPEEQAAPDPEISAAAGEQEEDHVVEEEVEAETDTEAVDESQKVNEMAEEPETVPLQEKPDVAEPEKQTEDEESILEETSDDSPEED